MEYKAMTEFSFSVMFLEAGVGGTCKQDSLGKPPHGYPNEMTLNQMGHKYPIYK